MATRDEEMGGDEGQCEGRENKQQGSEYEQRGRGPVDQSFVEPAHMRERESRHAKSGASDCSPAEGRAQRSRDRAARSASGDVMSKGAAKASR